MQNAAIRAEAPLQCAAVRIQAVWRRKWRTWIYRRQWGAALFLHVRGVGRNTIGRRAAEESSSGLGRLAFLTNNVWHGRVMSLFLLSSPFGCMGERLSADPRKISQETGRIAPLMTAFPLSVLTKHAPLISKFVDMDKNGRQAAAVLGRATTLGSSACCGVKKGRVHRDPNVVPTHIVDVEVSTALPFRALLAAGVGGLLLSLLSFNGAVTYYS